MGNNLNTITITTTVKATTIATVKMSMRLNRSLKFKFGGKKRRSSTVGGSISSSFSKNAAEQDYEDYPQYDPEDFESDSDSDDSEEEEIYSSPPVSPQSLQAQQCPATWSASSTVSKDNDGKKKNKFGRKVLSKAANGNNSSHHGPQSNYDGYSFRITSQDSVGDIYIDDDDESTSSFGGDSLCSGDPANAANTPKRPKSPKKNGKKMKGKRRAYTREQYREEKNQLQQQLQQAMPEMIEEGDEEEEEEEEVYEEVILEEDEEYLIVEEEIEEEEDDGGNYLSPSYALPSPAVMKAANEMLAAPSAEDMTGYSSDSALVRERMAKLQKDQKSAQSKQRKKKKA